MQEFRPVLFNELVLSEKLFEHCLEIDEAAETAIIEFKEQAPPYGYAKNNDTNAEPNSLYFWEEDDPEDGSYAIVDEFEECEMRGDESGKQKAAQDYLEYWEAIKNNPASSHEAFNSQRYNWPLDAYALFLSLHTICECSEMLAHKANRGIDPENLELYR